MPSRLRIILIMSVAAFLAGWLSYRQAYTRSSDKTRISNTSRTNDRRPRALEAKSDDMEVLRQLLARPVNARTDDETWTVVSRLSIARIKDALAALPVESTRASQYQEMALYFRWAQLDHLAALESAQQAAAGERKMMATRSAFTAWMKMDPGAAYQWARKSQAVSSRIISLQMMKMLSSLPTDEALEKAKDCSEEMTSLYLSKLGESMGDTPEKRHAFLDVLARSGSSFDGPEAPPWPFIQSWAKSDPVGARAGLDDLPMDEALRLYLQELVTLEWIAQDPGAVIAWTGKGEAPEDLNRTEIYRSWFDDRPEEASLQFENLSREVPGLREELMKYFLTSYYQDSWDERDANVDSLLLSRLKTHYDLWATTAPAQASAWIASLDPELQQKLKTPDPHEKN
jgi:hypothetical protein